MAEPAIAFDPFQAAGWVVGTDGKLYSTAPPATNDNPRIGLSPVIDVGGETNIDPRAAPGAPGSGLAPSQVGGPQTTSVAPPIVPAGMVQPATGTGGDSFQDTMRILNGGDPHPVETITPAVIQTTSPAPVASKTATFDPFKAAGWIDDGKGKWAATPSTLESPASTTLAAPSTFQGPPAPVTSTSMGSQELRAQPWHQPLTDAVMSVLGGMKSVKHGASFGLDEILDPLIPAITKSISQGIPFTKAYDQEVSEQRQIRKQFEGRNPALGTTLELAGSIPGTVATGLLFGTAGAGAGMAGRALNFGRNVTAGAGLGATTGFTMTDGDVDQRLKGAQQGAKFGAALSAATPLVVGGARRVATTLAPTASVDTLAGQALRERAGLGPHDPVPIPVASPIPNMPVGAGAAMNNPGLAAQERTLNSLNDRAALDQRTAQNTAIHEAATTTLPGAVRPLANAAEVPEASTAVVRGMQNAYDVLRTESGRRWSLPALVNSAPDMAALQDRVRREVAALPTSVRNALAKSGDVQGALDDLYALPPGSSLVDVNNARSDILASSRALPFDQRKAKLAADKAADAILKAIESNPALRTDPAAMLAYNRARDFTNRMWSALDTPHFQRMIQATEGNRKGLDPAMVAGGAFNFRGGSEKTPGGVSRVTDLLDDVRRQWGALRTSGAGLPATHAGMTLDPSVAFAARAELAQGARDYIINSMLSGASNRVRDTLGNPNVDMNRLSQWIDRNQRWIERSGIFGPDQTAILQRIRDAAVLAAKTEGLRGGTNSATFERLAGNNYADVFMGPIASRLGGALGGGATALLASKFFPEGGIGMMLGMELAGLASGPAILRAIYRVPRETLIQRIEEAIRNPTIAHDLMQRAGSSMSPETQAWMRSVLAADTSGEMARLFGSVQQKETVH